MSVRQRPARATDCSVRESFRQGVLAREEKPLSLHGRRRRFSASARIFTDQTFSPFGYIPVKVVIKSRSCVTDLCARAFVIVLFVVDGGRAANLRPYQRVSLRTYLSSDRNISSVLFPR